MPLLPLLSLLWLSYEHPLLLLKGLRSRRQAAPAALQPNPATAAAAAAVPGWVGEWRLQLALRSPACFQVGAHLGGGLGHMLTAALGLC